MKKFVSWAVGLVVLALFTAVFAIEPAEAERIEALLVRVQGSDVVFVRNGKRHEAAEAAAHLRMKWQRGAKYANTAEQFIDRIASGSSITGRPYFVVLPGGTELEAGRWLHARLSEIDAQRR